MLVLAAVAVGGAGLLERAAGHALASRLEQAQRDAPGLTHRVRFGPEVERTGAESELDADLRRLSTVIENAAPAPLRPDLAHDSTRIALPNVRTGDGTTLSLVYASDAPPRPAYAAGRPPAPAPAPHGRVVEIAVSTHTRDAMKLRLGQELKLGPGALENVDAKARVVGFYAAGSDRRLWSEQPLLARPARGPRGGTDGAVRYAGALLAPRGAEVLQSQANAELTVIWGMRLDPGGDAARFVGDQGGRDFERLMLRYPESVRSVTCDLGMVTQSMPCALGTHPATETESATELPDAVAGFQRQWRQGTVVISFALASVTAVGFAAVVVGALLSVRRRLDVHRLQRARGASATGLALGRAAETAPAVLLGYGGGCAVAALLPGASSAYGLGLLVAVSVWLVLPLLTWWAVRDRALLRDKGAGRGRRAVAEAGVVVLALAGVFALRARGTEGDAGGDPLLAAVPVLLGLATVVVLVRLYPLPVRLAARWAGRGRGAVALIAFSRAAKEAPARALALLVLVVTLAGAVFGGLVAGTLTEGRRDAVAWRVGADAAFLGAGRDPDTAGRLARARGVRETAAVRQLRVDPVSGTDGGRYGIASLVGIDTAKLRTATPRSPAARALRDAGLGEGEGKRKSARHGRGSRPPDIRVLADAADAGDLLTITVHGKERRLRVVGALPDAVRNDPVLGPVRAAAEGREHLLLTDNRDLEGFDAGEFEESALLLYGPHLDVSELRSVVPRTAPGTATGELRVRAEEQAEADDDGLTAALTTAYTACTALAVLLALLALVLELLLSAPARGSTAARLRTLGLDARATAGLHLLQLLPLVLAAVAGGVALGLTLPQLLGPALDLREFTGGPAAPAPRTDALFTAALAAGTVVLMAAAVGAETWLGRRRGLGAVLRMGRHDD
ncbi:membrane protein [Streptomyces longisporoflavus]|nr:membrane protein [Streptomyces longisporoflavus]